ncbi:MAG: alpha-amylase family glycosyl hydrolase [Acidobacteriaceae bacterium]|nr:alpha-amylase family glycosyl hydrolase [Acidobacteriaceae bacterium]
MEFHIRRDLRDKLELDDLLFSYTGNIVFANVAASRKLAEGLNKARQVEKEPDRMIHGGALYAMGMIDELSHALIAKYRREVDPAVLREAVPWLVKQLEQSSPKALNTLLLRFTELFPNTAIYRGEMSAAEWLQANTESMPNREAALEELLLLWLANQNPAFAKFKDLFGDAELQRETVYPQVADSLPLYFKTRPAVSPELGSLLDVLRAPMMASPDSLTGQLDYIRTHWSAVLGDELRRVLLAIDTLREEDLAIWMRFNPARPDWYRHGQPGRGDEGFSGDEFVGFEDEWTTDAQGRRVRRYAQGYQAPLHEYEAFSADQAWMPNVVMIAKSTYVWLEQLSKKYQRHIHRLDQVPEEELSLLADRGITALWLIGLWERSVASRTIKHLRGHSDAVASAYSLKDYSISADLGGYEAYEHLRSAAARFGVRLASDMVPNHMGIDSPWLIENPDAFLYRWESPYPSYTFEGPDLSTDPRVEIKLEDHYYDQTDAAVVFRLRHYSENKTRYVYHGNDGTTFAWNDTAQLDYSKAWVREQVMQAILHVARMFPIIRFDAAMVLAKRHVQRLWFPLPGAGGSIPSRAESAMSQEEFDALMPHEFWREVVDRVAQEVPGTLLLAEAFWLLEGYFVRTLGMHRVYNSAFMNMLRDEENAKYRSYLKKTIEFDPDILKRYVNFMSNPDERTTIDQFGSGDKCFGVATLLATLPGLPMFGHGQIEGYTERYGMEFKQARMDEWPNEGLVARHMHEIAPLLKRRHIFAESANFVLYDFWNEYGAVDENVFAYSNCFHGDRSLVLYNNSYETRRGTIHHSAVSMEKASGELRHRSLAQALDLVWDDQLFIGYRDHVRGLEYLRRANDFHRNGFSQELRGYQYVVLLDWRELRATEGQPWHELCDALHGAGVHSLDAALRKLRLRPLHDALHVVLAESATLALLAESSAAVVSETPVARGRKKPSLEPSALQQHEQLERFEQHAEDFYRVAAEFLPGNGSSTRSASLTPHLASVLRLPALEREFSAAWPPVVRNVIPPVEAPVAQWIPVLAWVLLANLPLKDDAASVFDRLALREALAEIFSAAGLEGESAWRAAARVRVALAFEPNAMTTSDFWQDGDVRWLAGVNVHEEVMYANKEAFEELLCWLQITSLAVVPELSSKALQSVEKHVSATMKAMEVAQYRITDFLAPAKKKRATTTATREKASASAKATSKKAIAGRTSARKSGTAKGQPSLPPVSSSDTPEAKLSEKKNVEKKK